MQENQRRYSLHAIQKEGLLMQPNGMPYKDLATIRRYVSQAGHQKTLVNRGKKVYGLTMPDIEELNKWIYEQHIAQ